MDEEGIETIKRLKFTGVGLIKATKADLQKERIVLGDIYLLLEAREKLLRKDKSKNHSDGDNKSDDLEDPAGFKALSKFDQAQIRAIWKTNFIGRRISDSDLQKFKQTPTIKRIQQVKQISLHDYFRKKANRHNDRFSQKTSNSDILIPSDNEEELDGIGNYGEMNRSFGHLTQSPISKHTGKQSGGHFN